MAPLRGVRRTFCLLGRRLAKAASAAAMEALYRYLGNFILASLAPPTRYAEMCDGGGRPLFDTQANLPDEELPEQTYRVDFGSEPACVRWRGGEEVALAVPSRRPILVPRMTPEGLLLLPAEQEERPVGRYRFDLSPEDAMQMVPTGVPMPLFETVPDNGHEVPGQTSLGRRVGWSFAGSAQGRRRRFLPILPVPRDRPRFLRLERFMPPDLDGDVDPEASTEEAGSSGFAPSSSGSWEA